CPRRSSKYGALRAALRIWFAPGRTRGPHLPGRGLHRPTRGRVATRRRRHRRRAEAAAPATSGVRRELEGALGDYQVVVTPDGRDLEALVAGSIDGDVLVWHVGTPMGVVP